ncbi:3-isopropylmalate dehydrogenase [Bacillus sp. MKU004]|nr:3-isopropylmalate dehydrogenase [Bacillus sp. MKU004]
MTTFFLILIGVFIVSANIIGFLSFKKEKSLYSAAFTILLLSVVFGGFGGVLALVMIRDAFAIFYGLQVGFYLLINSLIVLLAAIFVTVVRKYKAG